MCREWCACSGVQLLLLCTLLSHTEPPLLPHSALPLICPSLPQPASPRKPHQSIVLRLCTTFPACLHTSLPLCPHSVMSWCQWTSSAVCVPSRASLMPSQRQTMEWRQRRVSGYSRNAALLPTHESKLVRIQVLCWRILSAAIALTQIVLGS